MSRGIEIDFKHTCKIREIELIFAAMENSAKHGDGESVLLLSDLLQKRLKQCDDFSFIQSEQTHCASGDYFVEKFETEEDADVRLEELKKKLL